MHRMHTPPSQSWKVDQSGNALERVVALWTAQSEAGHGSRCSSKMLVRSCWHRLAGSTKTKCHLPSGRGDFVVLTVATRSADQPFELHPMVRQNCLCLCRCCLCSCQSRLKA